MIKQPTRYQDFQDRQGASPLHRHPDLLPLRSQSGPRRCRYRHHRRALRRRRDQSQRHAAWARARCATSPACCGGSMARPACSRSNSRECATWAMRGSSFPMRWNSAHQEIAAFYRIIVGAGVMPLSVGGDHSISLPILRAVGAGRPVGHDPHRRAFATPAATTWARASITARRSRARSRRGCSIPTRCIQIGIRGTTNDPDMWGFSRRAGMRVLDMDEFHDKGWRYAAEEARHVVGDRAGLPDLRHRQPGPGTGARHRHAGGRRHHGDRGAAAAARLCGAWISSAAIWWRCRRHSMWAASPRSTAPRSCSRSFACWRRHGRPAAPAEQSALGLGRS